jgi:hypothetical protein
VCGEAKRRRWTPPGPPARVGFNAWWSSGWTAAELGIEESLAAKRYILALKQLNQMLAGQ